MFRGLPPRALFLSRPPHWGREGQEEFPLQRQERGQGEERIQHAPLGGGVAVPTGVPLTKLRPPDPDGPSASAGGGDPVSPLPRPASPSCGARELGLEMVSSGRQALVFPILLYRTVHGTHRWPGSHLCVCPWAAGWPVLENTQARMSRGRSAAISFR